MPEAICWTTDQLPLAHCWKEVPPIQFHMPSVGQGPVIAEPEPEGVEGVFVAIGAAREGLMVEGEGATGADGAAGELSAGGLGVGDGPWVLKRRGLEEAAGEPEAIGAKTPPGSVAVGEAAGEPEPEPDPESPPEDGALVGAATSGPQPFGPL